MEPSPPVGVGGDGEREMMFPGVAARARQQKHDDWNASLQGPLHQFILRIKRTLLPAAFAGSPIKVVQERARAFFLLSVSI